MLAQQSETAVPDVDHDAVGGGVGAGAREPVPPRALARRCRQRPENRRVNRSVPRRLRDQQVDVAAGIGVPLGGLEKGVRDPQPAAGCAQLVHDLQHALRVGACDGGTLRETRRQLLPAAHDRVGDPHDDSGPLGDGAHQGPIEVVGIEARIVQQQPKHGPRLAFTLRARIDQHKGLGSVSACPSDGRGEARRVSVRRLASRAPLRHRS